MGPWTISPRVRSDCRVDISICGGGWRPRVGGLISALSTLIILFLSRIVSLNPAKSGHSKILTVGLLSALSGLPRRC